MPRFYRPQIYCFQCTRAVAVLKSDAILVCECFQGPAFQGLTAALVCDKQSSTFGTQQCAPRHVTRNNQSQVVDFFPFFHK